MKSKYGNAFFKLYCYLFINGLSGMNVESLSFVKACKFRRCRLMWCYHGAKVVGIHCWIRKYIFLDKTWSLNSLDQLIRSALWTMLFSTPWTLWEKGEHWYLARDSFPLYKTTVLRNSGDSFDVVAQRLCTENNLTFWLVALKDSSSLSSMTPV